MECGQGTWSRDREDAAQGQVVATEVTRSKDRGEVAGTHGAGTGDTAQGQR